MRHITTLLAVLALPGCGGWTVNDLIPPRKPPTPLESCQDLARQSGLDVGGAEVIKYGPPVDFHWRKVGLVAGSELNNCVVPNDPQVIAQRERELEASRVAQAKLEATWAAKAKEGEVARVATSTATEARSSCGDQNMLSACLVLADATAVQECLKQCIEENNKNLNARARSEQQECIERYVEAGARGAFSCVLEGATPGIDQRKLMAEVKLAWSKALAERDGAMLDRLFKQSNAQFLGELQTDCTKACNARGRDTIAIQKQGDALVTSYKRCMVAADSTLEARKLAAYEEDLYCDYFHKADARCRAASRCDRLEELSSLQCTYASPGIDRCQ